MLDTSRRDVQIGIGRERTVKGITYMVLIYPPLQLKSFLIDADGQMCTPIYCYNW